MWGKDLDTTNLSTFSRYKKLFAYAIKQKKTTNCNKTLKS